MDSPASRWSIDRAVLERDFAYLAKLIGDPTLTDGIRAHLAKMVLAVLTKKIKFPAHRVAKSKTFQDKILIGGRVQDLKHQRVKKPVQKVAVEFDCSVRKVEACWAVYQDFSQKMQADKDRDDYEMDEMAMANEAHRAEAVQSLKDEHGDRDFSEEEIRDAEHELGEAWAERHDYWP